MPRAPSALKAIRPAPRRAPRKSVAGGTARRAVAEPAADPVGEPPTATRRIVDSITAAIVERRLMPGTKLAEQAIADIFKVSRTLVRQALNQLSRDHLVTLEPARGVRTVLLRASV